MPHSHVDASYRLIARDRDEEFARRGFKRRWFFPHRIYYLPKCGPDGFKLAERMVGCADLDACWEIVLYADASAIEEFPARLFFDRDIVWHQQHFGRPGQIATANLVLTRGRVYSMVHLSDIVQRIGRARLHKTRIENQFEGWVPMLVNAVFNFALEAGARTVAFATADLAIRHTDRARQPKRELFDRTYDRRLQEVADVRREGDWWIADVAAHAGRMVMPTQGSERLAGGKTICLSHDIERGTGHVTADPSRAAHADAHADAYLDEMLAIEAHADVRATYNIVGCLLDRVRDRIDRGDHALGFHSFDHVAAPRWPARLWNWRNGRGATARGQLDRCRDVDYRIRGYRPPRSRWTAELTEERLCRHNFEWLATSRIALRGLAEPILDRRLVKIPIAIDDFALYTRRRTYAQWEADVLRMVDRTSFVVVSLHDCYGDFWLRHYRRLIDALRARGTLRTLDEVADRTILASALLRGAS